MAFGGALSLCNIYSGLKVGFTTNMSIAAALLGYALFSASHRSFGTLEMGLQENAVQQTTASAAATIAGAGLVAPIPALTMLTGRVLGYGWLVLWVLNVSVLGVIVGIALRRELIVASELAFPYGQATAEVLREMYARSREAMVRAQVLIGSMIGAASLKLYSDMAGFVPKALTGSFKLKSGLTVSLHNLGFALDPSLLMVGVGALIGLRAALSVLAGAVVAWLVLAPALLSTGMVEADALDAGDAMWFEPLSRYLLWPGVSLMVCASLTSFAISSLRASRAPSTAETSEPLLSGWLLRALVGAGLLSIVLQHFLFDVPLLPALAAVALSFGLAIVAGRVTGETGIAPIGAMGKITQLVFAVISPANATTNLMAANVTGGAASQCADMLHDLKTGHIVGARQRDQAVAQMFGVLSGALCGSACYLLLVPDPAAQLLTTEWPAPAVAQWKAVAEVFSAGVSQLPPFALSAAAVAGLFGSALALTEQLVSPGRRRYLPSATSMGLAFVLPAYFALSVAAGGVIAAFWTQRRGGAGARLVFAIASGIIAGESLAGIFGTLARMR